MAGIRSLLKIEFFVVVLLVGVCSQGICFPVTAKDDRGKEVEFKEPPRRIVSLVPTQTELLFSLGLGKRVVGVTNYCNYPEAAKQKEKIGGFAEIDSEKIRALNPDLILSFGTIQLPATEKLEKSGMKVFWMYPHTVSQILASIERVGEITGARREAAHLRESLEKDIRALRETLGTIPDEKRP
ncbi:MAG TPA: helical backbone metal receptor, partial [Nitrospirota bacterium]